MGHCKYNHPADARFSISNSQRTTGFRLGILAMLGKPLSRSFMTLDVLTIYGGMALQVYLEEQLGPRVNSSSVRFDTVH